MLESFRLEWKEELDTKSNTLQNTSDSSEISQTQNEERIHQLWNQNRDFGRLSTVHETDSNSQGSTKDNENNVVKTSNTVTVENAVMSEEEKEKLASNIFIKGVEMERSGKLYEAVKLYKKAIHLVPDIEKRATEKIIATEDVETETENSNSNDTLTSESMFLFSYYFDDK